MSKQKLEAKLEQVQTKRNAIFDDIESLRSNEQDADKEIVGIKAEIEALGKPELRHGDYGFGGNWNKNTHEHFVYTKQSEEEKTFYASGMGQIDTSHSKHPVLGNIFDDLAAIGEPLEKFTAECNRGEEVISCRIHHNNEEVVIQTENGHDIYFTKDSFHDLILNLRRMEATLKA